MTLTKKTKDTKEGRHTVKEPTRRRLFAEYAEKLVRKVLQIDRWFVPSDKGRGGGRR
jgi:hypothetical protein